MKYIFIWTFGIIFNLFLFLTYIVFSIWFNQTIIPVAWEPFNYVFFIFTGLILLIGSFAFWIKFDINNRRFYKEP